MEIKLECEEYILLNHGKVIIRGTYEQCLEIQLEYECIYAWAMCTYEQCEDIRQRMISLSQNHEQEYMDIMSNKLNN